jgi:hypothetical protein
MTLSILGDKQGDSNEGQGQLLIDGTTAYNATNGTILSASGAGSVIVFRGKYTSGGAYTGLAAISGSKENATDGDYGGSLRFYTRTNGANNPNEWMRITNTGNVGIGTSFVISPYLIGSQTGVLQVATNVAKTATSNSYPVGFFGSNDATYPLGLYIGILTGSTTGTRQVKLQGTEIGLSANDIVMNSDGGSVLINTTTNAGYKLVLNGQPGANGYSLWTNYSDLRLKENIIDLDATNILDKICKIRPVTFNYNELSGYDEDTKARRISGFIAQELKEIFPDMVGKININGLEYYDTNLSNLPLYLVKAFQKMQEEIEILKLRLNNV